MKRLIAILLITALMLCLLAGCKNGADPVEASEATDTQEETAASAEASAEAPNADYSGWRVALLTDEPEIDEHSWKQLACDACREWCEVRGVVFGFFSAAENTTSTLTALVDSVVADGFNMLFLAGWTRPDAMKEVTEDYPNVKFILMDVPNESFGKSYVLPNNACFAIYQEQLAGFMAGYAAVKLGYRHLAFVGGTSTPASVRYGYGFVQGADAAALDLGTEREIAVEHVFANTASPDTAVAAYVEDLYRKKGVEICFACGGIESSVCEAAQKIAGAKVIGADVDRAELFNPVYGEAITVTSAMKNADVAVQVILSDLIEKKLWYSYGGKTVFLGVASGDDLSANYVGLAPSTQFEDGKFTADDYTALVAALLAGEYTVSGDLKSKPPVTIAVNYLSNIK